MRDPPDEWSAAPLSLLLAIAKMAASENLYVTVHMTYGRLAHISIRVMSGDRLKVKQSCPGMLGSRLTTRASQLL
ncbi:MAG: hypothetical protein HRU31_13980 [Rhodobacteraceae bacterium]|nr:hypothetical protein [Paracoccaceae bacterium]